MQNSQKNVRTTISLLFCYNTAIRLCIKQGIQERGTECGERWEWGDVIFRGMSPNIPGNVAKHSRECSQTFQGNVAKHSGECSQTFRGMSPNILGNVAKHSGECR